MKDKKKVGLVKRIAAGVCAVVMVFICMEAVPFYAGENSSECEEWFLQNKDLYLYRDNVNLQLPDVCNDYSYYRVYHTDFNGSRFVLYLCNKAYTLCGEITKYENNSVLYSYALFTGGYDAVYSSSDGITWNVGSPVPSFITCNFNSDGSYDYLDSSYNTKLVYSNYDLCGYVSGKLFLNGYAYDSFNKPESYNSSLGYLQDLLCKELYLEDAEYAYDPNYLKKIWTFSNTSTSGLDITDGSYSVRHYQQITVRDTDIKDPVVKEYDMILMNEFPAASLRYEYMSKDYTSRLEAESGFEPLGFWETSILGQFVFTRNYFQLVRTNEDGSVEYGGLVKIDLKGSPAANDLNAEHETTTVTPEGVVDQDGYVGGNMDYIQGSGSDYGEAENDADKNYEDEISSSGGSKDLAAQVENLIAVVMAVPRLIAELFSFLPPWCLDFVGIAFTISIGILVFKLAN